MNIDLDYLQILQAALAARNLSYVVAGKVLSTDATPLPGIERKDWDVLLVDASRVTVDPGVIARTFQYNVGPIAPGVDKRAGFVLARATIDGVSVALATTHLESDLGSGTHDLIAQLRAAQMAEIVTELGAASPAIVMADLNDPADSPMHQVLTGTGFTDLWRALRPGVAGLTCCYSADLSDPRPDFVERIDFVFERGLERPGALAQGSIGLVGVRPWERVQGPAGLIWSSDHAGIAAPPPASRLPPGLTAASPAASAAPPRSR